MLDYMILLPFLLYWHTRHPLLWRGLGRLLPCAPLLGSEKGRRVHGGEQRSHSRLPTSAANARHPLNRRSATFPEPPVGSAPAHGSHTAVARFLLCSAPVADKRERPRRGLRLPQHNEWPSAGACPYSGAEPSRCRCDSWRSKDVRTGAGHPCRSSYHRGSRVHNNDTRAGADCQPAPPFRRLFCRSSCA